MGKYILSPNVLISGIHPHLQAQGNPSSGSNLRCSAFLQEMETAADTGRLLNRLLEKTLISLPALTHMSRSCERHETLNTKAELEMGTYPGVMRTKVSLCPSVSNKGKFIQKAPRKSDHDNINLN